MGSTQVVSGYKMYRRRTGRGHYCLRIRDVKTPVHEWCAHIVCACRCMRALRGPRDAHARSHARMQVLRWCWVPDPQGNYRRVLAAPDGPEDGSDDADVHDNDNASDDGASDTGA